MYRNYSTCVKELSDYYFINNDQQHTYKYNEKCMKGKDALKSEMNL